MTAKRFVFVTFLMIVYFFIGRFIGWTFLKETRFWGRIINDNFHHYQLGIALLLISFILLKQHPKLRFYLLSIGSGMVIDEVMYIFEFINPIIFSHYHPIGFLIELFVFIVFSFLILGNEKKLLIFFNSK